MTNLNLIFPHQLFRDNPLLAHDGDFVLIEEWLFFQQYPFHQAKIAFHRASMKFYEDFLKEKGKTVQYVEATSEQCDIRTYIAELDDNIDSLTCVFPTDNWLQKHLEQACHKYEIQLIYTEDDPMFLNSKSDNEQFFRADKKKFFQTSFYKDQRKRLNLLLEAGDQPTGGKWSFDDENRKKYPKKKTPPNIQFPEENTYVKEARNYVDTHFSTHYGSIPEHWFYPTTYDEAEQWLQQFFQTRFHEFGDYEDAIVAQQSFLHHGVLTPMLNSGLLTPSEVIEATMEFHEQEGIPINSLEGFIRQIIGWREFIRGIYEVKGTEERTKNFWNFSKSIPASFYDGSTGIPPIDLTIKKVLNSGYCHHIERLMVLSNFMLLCEFDPDEVYQWFMELFIDAYDWVMVPNVYGMGQFADGGLMSTKPYISSSNYLHKMSDYPKGDWQKTWDALFWRFMHVHRDFFSQNARLGMIYRSWDKKSTKEQNIVLQFANEFLKRVDSK